MYQTRSPPLWAEARRSAVFVVELPLARDPDVSEAPAPDHGLRGLRILIVVDHPISRRTSGELCASWGVRTDVCAPRGEAIALLHAAAAVSGSYHRARLR